MQKRGGKDLFLWSNRSEAAVLHQIHIKFMNTAAIPSCSVLLLNADIDGYAYTAHTIAIATQINSDL